MKLRSRFSILIASIAVFLTSCSGGKEQIQLTGAGATFPLPFYNLAFKTYQQTDTITVNYGGIGSGGGIRSLKDQIVDFGGTDAYLSDIELGEMPSKVLHIPSCMGAVVVSYNVPGVEKLNLSHELITGIYTGEINNWNDAKIQSENPEVTFPNLAITPVYRSDGSGTTFVFSDYLNKVNKSWSEKFGCGKSLKWDAGVAAKGNPGVAGTVKQTEGAIGYIGSEYALAVKLPVASIKNSAGNYIQPSEASISASGAGDIPQDCRAMITNSAVAEAYPISCFTWLILYQEQNYANRSKEQAIETVEMLNWLLEEETQNMTKQVHYAPLPAKVRSIALEQLQQITYDGAAILK